MLDASDMKLEEASSKLRFKKSLSTKWATLQSLAIACGPPKQVSKLVQTTANTTQDDVRPAVHKPTGTTGMALRAYALGPEM